MNKLEWKDISINQYLQIQKIIASDADEFSKIASIVKLIYNLDYDTIPMAEATQYIQEVTSLLQMKLEPENRNKYYKLDNIRYKVIPLEEMTLSQFMDYQSLAATDDDHLVDVISVCLVPVGHKYNDGYDMEETKKAIGNMPITVGPTLVRFFQNRLSKYMTFSLSCSAVKILKNREMSWKQKKTILRQLPRVMRIMDYFILR